MAKMLSEAIVRAMFTVLLLVSLTMAKIVPTVYSTNQPSSDTSVQQSLVSLQMQGRCCVDREFKIMTVRLLPGNEISAAQITPMDDGSGVEDNRVVLSYETKGGKYGQFLMDKRNAVIEVPLNSTDDWILFTPGGYYRLNYDAILWDRITKQMNDNYTVFSERSRTKLIDDAWNLAECGHLGYVTLLSLTRYASKEKYYVPWMLMYFSFKEIRNMIYDTENFILFQRHVLSMTSTLTDDIVELLDKNEEEVEENAMHMYRFIMLMSCSAGHKGCVENATRFLHAWIQNEQTAPIPAIYVFRFEVFCIAIENSLLESDWNAAFERFTMASGRGKSDLLAGLACSRNITLLERLLAYCTDAGCGGQALKEIASNPASKSIVWDWFKRNSAKTGEREALGFSMWTLKTAMRNLKTREQRQEVSDFLDNILTDSYGAWEYLHVIDTNIRRMNKNFAAVSSWLEQNVPK